MSVPTFYDVGNQATICFVNVNATLVIEPYPISD